MSNCKMEGIGWVTCPVYSTTESMIALVGPVWFTILLVASLAMSAWVFIRTYRRRVAPALKKRKKR